MIGLPVGIGSIRCGDNRFIVRRFRCLRLRRAHASRGKCRKHEKQADSVRMAVRKDAVLKSEKLDAEQKGAMTAGLGRMERGEIARLLTPEQKKEVLKKAHAAQAAAGKEKQQSSQ